MNVVARNLTAPWHGVASFPANFWMYVFVQGVIFFCFVYYLKYYYFVSCQNALFAFSKKVTHRENRAKDNAAFQSTYYVSIASLFLEC